MSDQQSKLLHCPKCGSEYVNQIHRKRLVKLLISRRKFQCTVCGKFFYVDRKHFRLDLSLIQ